MIDVAKFVRPEKSRAPTATQEQIDAVIAALQASRAIMTAEEIGVAIGAKNIETFRRKMRVIAEVAVPRIVSWPGSPGYVLWEYASNEILDACDDGMCSQVKIMTRRLTAYRIARARRLRATAAAVDANQGALALR